LSMNKACDLFDACQVGSAELQSINLLIMG